MYGINVNYLARLHGLKETVAKIAAAGFTKLDYTPPLRADDWQAQMREAMRIFAAYGLTVHQTHAPYNRYGTYGEQLKTCLARCMEATAELGAAYMVVHGDEFDFAATPFSPEAALDYNHHLFRPLVEAAPKSGFCLAFETVFEDGKPFRRFTSDIAELEALIRSFDCDSAVCCWDFGHANVSFGKRQAEAIRRIGGKIRCMHLHDNTGKDAHQMPMTGDIDWSAVTAAFREIGYDGVWSVEYAHGSMPEVLMSDFLRLTCESARYLHTLSTRS